MVESAPSSDFDVKKRRSTRIVQAVPLTVTGVDALGRPFQERTSTLIVNCHGCRYQSKHYVLKNMWITLEVPHPEAGKEARVARARVTWVQRPRTVRELFQIGVELEVAGNLWGIAFPPPDWFPYPEQPEMAVPAPAEITQAAEPVEPADIAEAAAPEIPTEVASEELATPLPDNVRVMGGPAPSDSSLALARQMARLVVEAKQQVQATAREAAAKAVAAETQSLVATLQAQLNQAVEKAAEVSLAPHAEQALRQALEGIEQARQAAGETLARNWHREVEQKIQEASQQLTLHLAQFEEAHRKVFDQQLDSHVTRAAEDLKKLSAEVATSLQGAEASIQKLRGELDQSAAGADSRRQQLAESLAEETRRRLEELSDAGRKLLEESQTAEAAWRARLDSGMAEVESGWKQKIETALAGALQQAAEQLAQRSQGVVQSAEQQLNQQGDLLRQSLEQAAAGAEGTIANLRGTLERETSRAKAAITQFEDAAGRMGNFAAEMDGLSQAAAQKLEERFQALLAAGQSGLNGQLENAVAGMAERLQPALEAAGTESVTRLATDLEQRLSGHLGHAGELLQKLQGAQTQSESFLREHTERLRGAAEQVIRESLSRLNDSRRQAESETEEAGKATVTRWLSELDSRATDITHTTFESLYKSSAWYEKKLQTQLQAALEKGLETAALSLREKAGEISGMFASELDHYSRSYVEHTQEQMTEASKETVQRAGDQLTQAAQKTTATFSEQVRRAAEGEVARFTGSLNAAFDNAAAHLETHAEQVRVKMDAEAQKFFADFQNGLVLQVQQAAGAARQQIESELAPVKDAWRAEAEAQRVQIRQQMTQLGDQAVESYKERLENVSNSWLVTTAATLSQQSQEMIGGVTKAAEQRLRQTCVQVFNGVGETLRQRLLDVASNLSTVPGSEEKRPPEK